MLVFQDEIYVRGRGEKDIAEQPRLFLQGIFFQLFGQRVFALCTAGAVHSIINVLCIDSSIIHYKHDRRLTAPGRTTGPRSRTMDPGTQTTGQRTHTQLLRLVTVLCVLARHSSPQRLYRMIHHAFLCVVELKTPRPPGRPPFPVARINYHH